MFEIRPLRNEADYDAALEAIAGYFENEPAPCSDEADRFDLLALVIADYEAKHWAIEAPDAPDLLRAQMPQQGFQTSRSRHRHLARKPAPLRSSTAVAI